MEWLNTLVGTLANWIYESLVSVVQWMFGMITKFPNLEMVPGLHDIWKYVTAISLIGIAMVIVYIGAKLFTTSGDTGSKLNLKTVIGRFIYAACMISLVKPVIDLLIIFNNTLVDAFIVKFNVLNAISTLTILDVSSITSFIAIGLMIYQIYLAAKITIGYWVRVAEVFLMYVASPIMITLWINPNWGAHLSSWLNRLINLIFTQFAQILILTLYSMLMMTFFTSGSFSSLFLGVACFILMNDIPSWLEKYIGADNSAKIMKNTYAKVKHTSGSIKRAFGKLNSSNK